MSQEDIDKKEKKAAMKKLRADRKEWVVKASGRVKVQKKALKAIKGHLEKGAATVPEVAGATEMSADEATEMSADEVLWYMAALKKYGQVVEAEKDGGYFRYALSEGTAQEAS